ncbi:hypothetical protein PsYK624_048550 [Phanerochaete sordida]|uniref:Oxidase ustYa n=1 Tax=Phanerochaete sordida TaxID=48140 RepID=A0A9P3G6J2_9APHY|nr:hypothetical protein PsYK624_048550 [Phanerochaete sordida]
MQSKLVLSMVFLTLSLLNLAYVVRRVRNPYTAASAAPSYAYRGHDFPEVFPVDDLNAGHPVYLHAEDSVHYPLRGTASDLQWLALTSAGAGYVRLGPSDRQFVLTMFHEMHCLRILNLAFRRQTRLEHVEHCLNYIRHGALCAPDLTLEPGDFEDSERGGGYTAGTHMCKDWGAVYAGSNANFRTWNASTTVAH